MAERLGTAWIEIRASSSSLPKDIQDAQRKVLQAVTGIEGSLKRSAGGVNSVSREYEILTKSMRSAQVINAEFDKGLRNAQGNLIKTGQSFAQLTTGILKAAPAFAVATAAISGVHIALRTLRDTFVRGLKAVEDYQLSVASMSAFLTTFADKSQEGGDIGKIYERANIEAKNLVATLEILDTRTIASGKDLTTIAQQFIKNGISIKTNNKDALDGFVAIANATKLLTAGQNQEVQLRQEIGALARGEVRTTNVLISLLKAKDKNIEKNLETWKKSGTVLENLKPLLDGFIPAARDLESTWAVVGSTISTIADRVLRGGMLPAYQDLINYAIRFKESLLDSEGNLTNQGFILQTKIKIGWEIIKGLVLDVKNTISLMLDALAPIFILVSSIAKGWAEINAYASPFLDKLAEKSSKVSSGLLDTTGKQFKAFWANIFGTDKEAQDAYKVADKAMRDLKKSFGENNVFSKDTVKEAEMNLNKLLGLFEKLDKPPTKEEKKVIEPLALVSGETDAEEKLRKKLIENKNKHAKFLEDAAKRRQAFLKRTGEENLQIAKESFKERVRINNELYDLTKDQKYYDEKERLNKMYIASEIDRLRDLKLSEDLLREYRKSQEEKFNQEKLLNSNKVSDGIIAGFNRVKQEIKPIGESIAESIVQSFSKMEDALVKFVETGKINFRDLVNSILSDMTRVLIKEQIVKPLSSGLAEFGKSLATSLFPSAHGNAFNNGHIMAYANGGIVDSPTLFNTKSGVGIAGEAGTEAILPLKRGANGDLGVQASMGDNNKNNQPAQIVVQYSPVIQAIDTQSGLQFLAQHSRVITGMVDQAYNKIGRRGIQR